MNENLNLCEILKNCPYETKLYCTVLGDVTFLCITENRIKVRYGNATYSFSKYGTYTHDGGCVLFPSKYQRDWSKFKVPVDKFKSSIDVFDPEEFKPFDKVLIKLNYECERWRCDFFSHMLPNGQVSCIGATVYECIPYNDETKDLLGTDEDAPETYKWWEE